MNLHQRNDTLSECDREAIHHIAAVQNFGGLIAADPQGRVVQASANIADLLGNPGTIPTLTVLFSDTGLTVDDLARDFQPYVNVPSYTAWLDRQDQTQVYLYLKKTLQFLQWH